MSATLQGRASVPRFDVAEQQGSSTTQSHRGPWLDPTSMATGSQRRLYSFCFIQPLSPQIGFADYQLHEGPMSLDLDIDSLPLSDV